MGELNYSAALLQLKKSKLKSMVKETPKTWLDVDDSLVESFVPADERELNLWVEFYKAALPTYGGLAAARGAAKAVIRNRRLQSKIGNNSGYR